MYLGAYRFRGDPADLVDAYDRMLATFPAQYLLVQICVTTADGLIVYDACPSQGDFEAFSTDPAVLAAMHEAGLPTPRIEQLGEVHRATAPALTRR